jgi:hypothetical protein
MIYVLRCGDSVMLGHAATMQAVGKRVRLCQRWNHQRVELLHVIEGDQRDLRTAYAKFGASRVRGTWLKYDAVMPLILVHVVERGDLYASRRELAKARRAKREGRRVAEREREMERDKAHVRAKTEKVRLTAEQARAKAELLLILAELANT